MIPPPLVKVLIIDDDPKHRDSLGDVIDSFGYTVESAENAEAAKVVIAEKGPFNIVLLDYMFGPQQKTGLDAIADLRHLLPVEEVPVLLMTGYASLEVAVRALRQGLSDFLLKPIDPTYLKHTLEKNLEKSRLLAENKRLFEELRKSNSELARLNDLKAKFLSFCAHDLSNTISGALMASDLLLRSFSLEELRDRKRFFTIMQDSIDQTQRLITDLVDYSSIDKGKLKIDKKPHTLTELLSTPLFNLMPEKIKQRNITFETHYPHDLSLTLNIDLKRVVQILANLLENALRYTSDKGVVRFSIAREEAGSDLTFRVEDSGQGIDPEDLPHLFESFYQGKDQTRQGRMGLGLAIAKEIVEGHGGQIWVESEGHGKGSAFSFKIPIG